MAWSIHIERGEGVSMLMSKIEQCQIYMYKASHQISQTFVLILRDVKSNWKSGGL